MHKFPEPIQRNDFPPEGILSGRQRVLYKELEKKDSTLASYYLGTLYVLKQDSNPDRLSLASHGFRELMEKVPRIFDTPLPKKPPNMMEKIRPFQKAWNIYQSISHANPNSTVSSFGDDPFQKFFEEASKFFTWLKENRPTRKKQAAKTLMILDPQGHPLPEGIEKLRVKEWDDCRDYFENVSHHNHTTTMEEFERFAIVLENFLLDRLAPRTSDDFSLLDVIIQEGESNG